MKSIISKSAFLLAFTLILFTSCKDGKESDQSAAGTQITDVSSSNRGQAFIEDESSEPNALRIAIGSPDHTTLVAAVQAAGVENALVNVGPLTVFAPTNAAFDKIDKATLDHLLKPENKSELAFILQHHVAPGNYSIETLERSAERGRNLGVASNLSLEVTKEGDAIYVDGVKIVGTVQASNGWVHIVEDVILPKN
jgi:uncharacterized surface protein with fasciclin (FAS1) repeats